MLTTFALGAAADAISPARSIVWLFEMWPERMIASSDALTRMSSPGKSFWSSCCNVVIAGDTTTSYWARAPAPQTMRLTVPAPLPSINTSRGWTTVASATAGFVTAIRLMSKSVVNTVERPAVSGIWIAAAALSWAAWAATPTVAYDYETSRIARANFRINGGPPQCVSPHGSPPRCTSPVGVEGAAGAVVQPQPRLCG